MAKRNFQYQESTNSIKFRENAFIIVVVNYENGMYNELKAFKETYIPKNTRWYIPAHRFREVAIFGRKYNFYFSNEAATIIKKELRRELEQSEISSTLIQRDATYLSH